MGEIRIGQISKVDYENGMVKVVYPDRDDAVTDAIPVFSLNGEYKMPKVGQNILVVHLSNKTTAGVALGGFWNQDNLSLATGKGIYRKELSNQSGKAFFQHDDSTGVLEINAEKIKFVCDSGTITLAQIISKLL